MGEIDNLRESAIPWMEEELLKVSTALPEIIAEEATIGTIVIIIVCAIFSITVLFMLAIFIDCRQQKLVQLKTSQKKSNWVLKIPKFNRKSQTEDNSTLANNMQSSDTSVPPSLTVIV